MLVCQLEAVTFGNEDSIGSGGKDVKYLWHCQDIFTFANILNEQPIDTHSMWKFGRICWD
jgi:hypothetical protein